MGTDFDNSAIDALRADLADLRALVGSLAAPSKIDLARVALGRTDILVAKVQAALTMEQYARIGDTLRQIVPDARVLVIDRDIDLSVLTRDEIDRLSVAT